MQWFSHWTSCKHVSSFSMVVLTSQASSIQSVYFSKFLIFTNHCINKSHIFFLCVHLYFTCVDFELFYVKCDLQDMPIHWIHCKIWVPTFKSDSEFCSAMLSHPGIKVSISWARWAIWAPIHVKAGTDPEPWAPQGGPPQGRALRPFPSCSSMTSSCQGGPLGAIERGSAGPLELTQQLLIKL